MDTYNLAETLEIEGYKKISLLPDRYDDAFVGIDELSDKIAVYSAEILDKIDENKEWETVLKTMKNKAPIVIEYCNNYSEYNIPNNMDGAAIGLSTKGNIAVLSYVKLIQQFIACEECSYDEADTKAAEFSDSLKNNNNGNILVVDGISGYDDIYNILSYENYQIEEYDDFVEYDDNKILKEIEQNIVLK